MDNNPAGAPQVVPVFNNTQRDTLAQSFTNPKKPLSVRSVLTDSTYSSWLTKHDMLWILLRILKELTTAPNQDGQHPIGSRLVRSMLFCPHTVWNGWVVLLPGGSMPVDHGALSLLLGITRRNHIILQVSLPPSYVCGPSQQGTFHRLCPS